MTRKQRILIADDDPYIRKLLTFQLTRTGYQVSLASNGLEAINLIRSQAPDLILLDLLMPNFSGLDVLEKLKETGNHIPAILMSAAELPIAHQVIVLSSPTNYLVKPFELKDLLSKINRLLGTPSI